MKKHIFFTLICLLLMIIAWIVVPGKFSKSSNDIFLHHAEASDSKISWEKVNREQCREVYKNTGGKGNRFTGRAFNSHGLSVYRKKNYNKAAVLFKCSIIFNKNHFWGHYNLASTLGLIIKKYYSHCDYMGDEERIDPKYEALNLLKTSIRLRPSLKKKARKDSDLKSLKDTFSYYLITGYSFSNSDDVKEMLVNLSWQGDNPGPVSTRWPQLNFQSNGSVKIQDLDMRSESMSTTVKNGTYKVSGNRIRIRLNNGKVIKGILTRKGKLATDIGTIGVAFYECGV